MFIGLSSRSGFQVSSSTQLSLITPRTQLRWATRVVAAPFLFPLRILPPQRSPRCVPSNTRQCGHKGRLENTEFRLGISVFLDFRVFQNLPLGISVKGRECKVSWSDLIWEEPLEKPVCGGRAEGSGRGGRHLELFFLPIQAGPAKKEFLIKSHNSTWDLHVRLWRRQSK